MPVSRSGNHTLDTGSLLVPSGHECSPCGTANSAVGMIIQKPDTRISQPVNIWSLYVITSVTAQVTVSKIIGHDEDDVGPLLFSTSYDD